MHGANVATGASLLTRAKVWLDSVPLFTRCLLTFATLFTPATPHTSCIVLATLSLHKAATACQIQLLGSQAFRSAGRSP